MYLNINIKATLNSSSDISRLLCNLYSLWDTTFPTYFCLLRRHIVQHETEDYCTQAVSESGAAGSNVCSSKAFMENTSDWMSMYGEKGKMKEQGRGKGKDISLRFSWNWQLPFLEKLMTSVVNWHWIIKHFVYSWFITS